MSVRRTLPWRPLGAARLGGSDGVEVVGNVNVNATATSVTASAVNVQPGDVLFITTWGQVSPSVTTAATVSDGSTVSLIHAEILHFTTSVRTEWARITTAGSITVTGNASASGTLYLHVLVLRGVSPGDPVLVGQTDLEMVSVSSTTMVLPAYTLDDPGIAIALVACGDNNAMTFSSPWTEAYEQWHGTTRAMAVAYEVLNAPGDTTELTVTMGAADPLVGRRLALRGPGR